MLPIILQPLEVKVGLAGKGEALARRRAHLTEAGITPVEVPLDDRGALTGLNLLYVAGVPHDVASAITGRARAQGVLVNVEDVPSLCDFHVPATVRRGDLLLTVSSAGRSPGLVRMVREWLADQFGAEWSGRLDEIGRKRTQWRANGHSPREIAEKTRARAAGWLG